MAENFEYKRATPKDIEELYGFVKMEDEMELASK